MNRILEGRRVVAWLAGLASVFAGGPLAVHAAQPTTVDALDAVAERHGLQRVVDAPGRQDAAALMAPFVAISGEVVELDAVMRRAEPGATLWLIDYRSRAPGPRVVQGRRTTIDVPLLAIIVALETPRDWPAFRQSAATPAPADLPADWRPRLAAMTEYRMGIEGRVVGFFSQRRSAALVQIAESTTSPEFHPNLRNSALGVDVQRALDLVAALPEAPRLARFMRIEGADPDLPEPDRAPLQRMRATMEQAKADNQRAAEQALQSMAEAGEASRRRAEADRERFRQRMAEITARSKARGKAAQQSSSADKTAPEADATADDTSKPAGNDASGG